MFHIIRKKISDFYYYNLLLRIPPKDQGVIDWLRIILWDYPKFVFIPRIFNKYQEHSHSKSYISYIPTNEGIGGQLYRYATTLVLADLFHLTYLHNPFIGDYHSPMLNWEQFLGFSNKTITLDEFLKNNTVAVCGLPKFDLRHSKDLQLNLLKQIIEINSRHESTLFLVKAYSFYPLNDYPKWPKILNKIKREYQNTKKTFPVINSLKKKGIHVALHIRRGDVTAYYKRKHLQGYSRWVEVSWYKNVLDQLVKQYDNKVIIDVFSDADAISELENLEHYPHTKVHLAKDSKSSAYLAFDAIVNADIIVCGLSAFSYFAASLSKGIKIVPSVKNEIVYFPKKNTNGWIFPDRKGNFDIREINSYISNKKRKS
jgi:hypothetical protein